MKAQNLKKWLRESAYADYTDEIATLFQNENFDELEDAFVRKTDKTKIILAKTVKGKGFSIMENKAHWHYWNSLNEKDIEICRKDIS